MELRPHQAEALAAIHAAAAAGEDRMTVVSACGTGKTLLAQRAARSLAPNGTVLVLMPTKALVTQTIVRWREAGQPGLALGLSSLNQVESGLAPSQALMIRRARALTRAMRVGGPITVFATYDSLRHIRHAHEVLGLPAWDLAIVDEAHRTCSDFGDGWGTIHDNAAVPVKTRLYMTATPRIWGAPAASSDLVSLMERAPLATMDHREIFGPPVFELGMAQAIDRGILADYQVIMPIVDDSDLHSVLTAREPGTTAHHNGLRNAAIQVAVLRAIHEYGLRRVLVFHNRVDIADAFAQSLPETARQIEEPLRIGDLRAKAIHARQSSEYRLNLLADFARTDRSCAVLSNVRVLNEGVDMPDVDGVVFADPRYSVIDAIQAIGRGLRQPPGAGKKTTLIIPVYLRRGMDATDLMRESAFANLLTLLQALRAHDESFMDRIALPLRSGRAVTPTGEHRHLYYAQPERAAQLARALGLEIALPAIGTWAQAHACAARYRQAFGHLDVPIPYLAPDGFALGEALASLRLRHLLGRLPADQQRALEDLGMRWSAHPPTFDFMLDHARTWSAAHGHLIVPLNEHIGGHRLGRWLATLRRKAAAGRLPAEHQQALNAVDPYWNPSWAGEWQRKYARARALAAGIGRPWRSTGRTYEQSSRDYQVAISWISKQRLRFFDLGEGRQALLLAAGIPPLPDGIYPDSADPRRHAFYETLRHTAVFLAREGHLDVPATHREPPWWGDDHQDHAPFPLGERLHQYGADPEQLTAEQQRALRGLFDLRRLNPPGPQST